MLLTLSQGCMIKVVIIRNVQTIKTIIIESFLRAMKAQSKIDPKWYVSGTHLRHNTSVVSVSYPKI